MSVATSQGERLVHELAAKQRKIWLEQPEELRGQFEREEAALSAYRGRQLLELLQNADDAGEGTVTEGTKDQTRECKVRIEVSRERLVIANTGIPFSEAGVKSLVISDCSPKILDRNRFIGCKGLGFRSVLTWSMRPIVSSGPYLVAFDRALASAQIEALCAEHEAIREVAVAYRRATKRWPAPIMRCPFVPSSSSDLEAARRLRATYDTVIVLPLHSDDSGSEKHADILAQLEGLGERALLFCRHVTALEIVGEVTHTWTLARQELGSRHLQHVIIGRDGHERLWSVYRPDPSEIPPAADRRAATREEYELAIAVPERPERSADATLCVFFPTKEPVPCSLALHATLDTNEDRNHVTATKTNKAVLAHLATCTAAVVAHEARNATREHRDRALELLAGIQMHEGPLGFSRALLDEVGKHEVFPTIGGRLGTSTEVRAPPTAAWTDPRVAPAFPEMIDMEAIGPGAKPLVGAFGLRWFDTATVRARLQKRVLALTPGDAGEMVGRLLISHQLSGIKPDDLTLSTDGRLLEGGGAKFFAPASPLPTLPAWATTNLRFVHPEFQAGLARGTGMNAVRALASYMSAHGGTVDEYAFETVARLLVEEAGKPDCDQRARMRDVVAWLYGASRATPRKLDDLNVKLALTRAGGMAPAKQCYFGPAYARGFLVARLYGQLANGMLIDAPAALGLPEDEASAGDVADFLETLGVSATPRIVDLSATDEETLIERVFADLDFPRVVRERSVKTRGELDVLIKSCAIDNAKAPERIRDIVRGKDTTALVAYLLSGAGQKLLADEHAENAVFSIAIGDERKGRLERSIPVPNPTVHFLREEAWVPTESGNKRPHDIVLGRQIGEVLKGFYARHRIEKDDPLIARAGGGPAVDRLLSRLGAISSLESLDSPRLYSLLLALPERDPNGDIAKRLCVALLDAKVEPEDCEERKRFLREGKLWGSYQGAEGYFPIRELRYNASVMLPDVLQPCFRLIALPERRSTELVKRLFDVAPLHASEVPLTVDEAATAYDDSSAERDAHLKTALVFLYALRVAATSEHGRDAARLARVQLRVCTEARVSAVLPGGEQKAIPLGPGQAIAVGETLLVVDEEPPTGWIPFWSKVAALLSDVIGTAAGEIGNVLRCENVNDMLDVTRGILGPKANECLAIARQRFADGPDEDADRLMPLPPPAQDNRAEKNDTPPPNAESTSEPDPAAPAQDANEKAGAPTAFSPVAGPAAAKPKRRKLVIAKKKATTPGSRGPVATEADALAVADAFERKEGRVPIDVDHIRGRDSFGCDRISVANEDIAKRAIAAQFIAASEVLRFIEVKGSSSRRRALELTENEFEKATTFKDRYFIYRVFVRRPPQAGFELATLQNPVSSKAVFRVTRFDLAEGSGADWYECTSEVEEAEETHET